MSLTIDEIKELLDSGHSVSVIIEPQKNMIGGREAEQLLGVSAEGIRLYREQEWIAGAHYFPQRNKRTLYNRDLLLHWQKYHIVDKQRHNNAVQLYLQREDAAVKG